MEASRNAAVFSSEPGVTTPEPPRLAAILFGESMVNMDNPRHARLRRIVSRAFSPKVMADQEAHAAEIMDRIIDDLVANRADNFVTAVAAPLPFHVLCDMLGVPNEKRAWLLDRINMTTAHAEAKSALRHRLLIPTPDRGAFAMLEMHVTMMRLAWERRRHPADDLLSVLVAAEADGKRLGWRDLGSFFSLLTVAGVETTRNAIAHALYLFTVFPEQRELLLSDVDKYLDTAIEEVLRFETPIIQFRRTIKQPYELHGVQLVPGDKVTLYYNSANRDEAVFERPQEFDITRDPNPHASFGGIGPHHCLGKLLARVEMRTVFREIFTRLPRIRSVGEPEKVASSFDNRIRRLEFTF
jgi:cytochrome P450